MTVEQSIRMHFFIEKKPLVGVMSAFLLIKYLQTEKHEFSIISIHGAIVIIDKLEVLIRVSMSA